MILNEFYFLHGVMRNNMENVSEIKNKYSKKMSDFKYKRLWKMLKIQYQVVYVDIFKFHKYSYNF